jgi:hypothetical protein
MKSLAAKTTPKHTSQVIFHRPSAPFFERTSSAQECDTLVNHRVQARPWFDKAHDRFEKEAETVADQVVEGRSLSTINGPGQSGERGLSRQIAPLVVARKKEKKDEKEKQVQAQLEKEEEPLQAKAERKENEEEKEKIQTKAERNKPKEEEKRTIQAQSESNMIAESEKEKEKDRIQRKAGEKEKEKIQRRAAAPLPSVEPGSLEPRLRASKGKGSPLPAAVRTRMEKSFGADFGGIRIHTDETAVELSRRLRAQAFTHGRDIYFNKDKFSPASRQGTHLLAHELTHTVQQGKVFPKPAAKVQKATEREPEEEFGWQAAEAAAAAGAPAPAIQRSWLDSVTGAAGVLWDATAGQLVDAAGRAIAMTSEMFWSLLETVAPAFAPIVREISGKGILGFLKEKISRALSHIFDGLLNGSALLGPLFATFVELAAQAAEIVLALASGDCKPLFAAVNRLKEMLAKLAGDAWNAITDFFAPIGVFFSNLWQSFGAPVLDWLKQTAADIWNDISGLGQQIWAWTQPVRDAAGSAWSWVKDRLGLGGEAAEGDSEGGLMKWVQGKAEEAWGVVKEELQPVIQPVQAVVEKVQAILPLEAIFNLRGTVQGWLSKAEAMGQAMGEDGSNVAEQQTSLRDEILPAILAFIESLRMRLIDTGLWISDKIGAMVKTVTGFIDSLTASPLVSGLQPAVMWIQTALLQLADWYRTSVVTVFNLVGDGLAALSSFIRPILDILNQIVKTLKNLMGKLPDLVLGPVWWLLPDCIKNPIKDFILNQILMRIPFFQQFLALGDIWAKVKDTALTILKQIFVDGNLLGALWTYFKAVLGLFGLPPQLITNIIIKAAQALGDIIANPIGFIINILKAIKEGFVRFFSNILKHLFGGVTDWLFGQIAEAGITLPKDFSLKSILDLVFQILGITMEKIWKKLADVIGQEKVDRLKKGIEFATGAWEWIKLAATEGPAAVWQQLKEKLSDLWATVLTGVVTWVNQVIIVQGTKWLLSLLDVSGIMPTITALIAIYKAIESFFEYLKEMLEIVNSVLNGIADVAKGAVGAAAGFLEGALANSVPIIIGFLANQFGLGRLGHRLREIIGAVHQKVDSAIDWLIEKAVSMGKAFLDTLTAGAAAVKGGVAGLMEWWKSRKEFTNKAGEQHTLFFKGSGPLARLMIGSPNETELDLYLKSEEEKQDDKTKKIINDEAKPTLAGLEVITRTEVTTQTKREEITGKITKLSKILMGLRMNGGREPELPAEAKWDTRETYGHNWVEGLSTRTSSLTGSPPTKGVTDKPDWWKLLHENPKEKALADNRRGADYWIRMHLISEKLGGSGTGSGDKPEGWKNLIPAPNSVNSSAKVSLFETAAKDLVTKADTRKKSSKRDKASPDKPNVIWLNVEATDDYNCSAPSPPFGTGANAKFFNKVKMRGGLHFYDQTKREWVKDSAERIKEDVAIPKPDFGPALPSLSNPSLSLLRGLSPIFLQKFVDFIEAEAGEAGANPFLNANDFEKRMRVKVNSDNSWASTAIDKNISDVWKTYWMSEKPNKHTRQMWGNKGKGIIPTIKDLVNNEKLKY